MIDKSKHFEVAAKNGKTLILTPKVPISKEWLDKYHLKEIHFSDSVSLKLGDKVPINFQSLPNEFKTYYKANFIYKEDKIKIRINEFEDNISSVYILPLLGIQKEHLLINYNFINCYVNHYNYKHKLGEYLYIIYRYTPIPYYSKFVSNLATASNYIDCNSEDKDKRFDCFVFKTNEIFIDDIKLILKGKYSNISEKAKKLILTFHNQLKSDQPLNQILYKGELRKNELESIFGCSIPKDIDYAEKSNFWDEYDKINTNNNETWKI